VSLRRAPLKATAMASIVLAIGWAAWGSRNVGSSPPSQEPLLAELVTLERAKGILVTRCMRRHGIPYVVPDVPPVAWLRHFPYVIDDLAWAQEHGFGGELQRKVAATKEADPNRRYFSGLSPERQRAVLAVLVGERPEGLSANLPIGGTVQASDEGCIAEAEKQLYGDLNRWFRARVIASNLTPLYMPKVMGDPRYKKALRNWARCMVRSGHAYESPEELRLALGTSTAGLSPEEAHAVEVQLAVAEARCAKSTKFGATARRLDRTYGEVVRKRYWEEVETKRRLQLAAVPKARALVRKEVVERDTTDWAP
jgi:hypothetical protein